MNLGGPWMLVGAIALLGVIVVGALAAFTSIGDTGLFIVGAAFGVAAGMAILAAQREDQGRTDRRSKRR